MNAESWQPPGEPLAIYYDRLHSWEQAQEYIDGHLFESYRAVSAHLAGAPDISSLRDAQHAVRYLVDHPGLHDHERFFMSVRYNRAVEHYGLDSSSDNMPRVPLIQPLVELALPVDELARIS